MEKVEDADGTVAISNLAPGKRYLVLDAGGNKLINKAIEYLPSAFLYMSIDKCITQRQFIV